MEMDRACTVAVAGKGERWEEKKGHLAERVLDVIRGRHAVVPVKDAEEAICRGRLPVFSTPAACSIPPSSRMLYTDSLHA
jgi:hypothetical protein